MFWQKNCFAEMLTHWSADILLPSFQYSVICFLYYFKFKGGKGVATALGVTTALAWQTFPIVMIPFVIIVAVSKMISLGSIISAVILPIATYFVYYFWYPECSPVVPTVATAVIALLIIFMHRTNIKRMVRGEENKLGAKKSDE